MTTDQSIDQLRARHGELVCIQLQGDLTLAEAVELERVGLQIEVHDALDHAEALRGHLATAQAEAAAMRAAIERLTSISAQDRAAHCIYCGADDHEDHAYTEEHGGVVVEHKREDCPLVKARVALSGTAGRALLDRLRNLEAVAEVAQAYAEAASPCTNPEHGPKDSCWRNKQLHAALAALKETPAAEEMLALHVLCSLPGHEAYLRHLEQ